MNRSPLSYDLHTEFAMWRQTLAQTRFAYVNGYMPLREFMDRLRSMGFLAHEITAEIAYLTDQIQHEHDVTLTEKELQTETDA